MNGKYFKEEMKDIRYVKGKASVFNIPSYDIKADKFHVITGECMLYVLNQMFY